MVSITGVPVIPISGTRSLQFTSLLETVLTISLQSRTGQKIGMPQLLSAVYVEGIELIMLGGHEQHIVGGTADSQVGHIQGLRVDVAYDRKNHLRGQIARR